MQDEELLSDIVQETINGYFIGFLMPLLYRYAGKYGAANGVFPQSYHCSLHEVKYGDAEGNVSFLVSGMKIGYLP